MDARWNETTEGTHNGSRTRCIHPFMYRTPRTMYTGRVCILCCVDFLIHGQRVLAYYATVRVILRGVTVRLWFNRKQKNRDSCPLRRRKILEKPCICTRNYFIFLNALWLTNRLIFFYVFAIIKNTNALLGNINFYSNRKYIFIQLLYYNNILKQNL